MPRKTKETSIKEQANLKENANNLIQPTQSSITTVKSSTSAEKKSKSASTTKVKASLTKTTKNKSSESSAKTTKRKTTKTKSEIKDTAKKSTKKSSTSAKSKTSTKKSVSTVKTRSTLKTSTSLVEYYDLPVKYNQTVVKVLYQNPTTLFVYWEISDDDMEYYKNTYGDNFFETTRPVLVVYNETMNYSFEIDINDFANSWYFNINDSKCNYRVELIRKPISYNEKITDEYIYITSSNKIETPNDRILFSTNEPYTVYFKNVKNNTQRKVNLPKLLEQLNLLNKDFGFPIVQNVHDLYKHIYHVEDVGEFSISLTNPSSGNPSSHSLSSRFI